MFPRVHMSVYNLINIYLWFELCLVWIELFHLKPSISLIFVKIFPRVHVSVYNLINIYLWFELCLVQIGLFSFKIHLIGLEVFREWEIMNMFIDDKTALSLPCLFHKYCHSAFFLISLSRFHHYSFKKWIIAIIFLICHLFISCSDLSVDYIHFF